MPGNAEDLGEAFLPNANPSAGDLGWALSRLLKRMALVSVLCLSYIMHFTLLVHLYTYNNAVIFHAFRNLERTHFPHFSVSLCNKIPQKNCKRTVSIQIFFSCSLWNPLRSGFHHHPSTETMLIKAVAKSNGLFSSHQTQSEQHLDQPVTSLSSYNFLIFQSLGRSGFSPPLIGCFFFSFLFKCMYLFRLHWVLVAAHGTLGLHCSMWDL